MKPYRVTKRTGERLVRLAYDLEYLANNIKHASNKEAFERNSETVRSMSQLAGKTGRDILDKTGG